MTTAGPAMVTMVLYGRMIVGVVGDVDNEFRT